jgi:pantothenate kinase type III
MLLADCGNSRCKLAAADRPEAMITLAYDAPDFAQRLADLAARHERLLLLPGSHRGAERLRSVWPHELHRLGHDLPLPDCGQYPGCGGDRVLAGLAAVERCRSNVIVINAGTALTVDAWRRDPDRAPPARFLGGCIAPGPEAMLAGLQTLAPALPLPGYEPDGPFPGVDTASCLLSGCREGFASLMLGLLARLREQTGIQTICCTGGWLANAALRARIPGEIQWIPALVPIGMTLAWDWYHTV